MTWWAVDVRTVPEQRARVGAWLVTRTGHAVEEREDGTLVTFAPDEGTADALTEDDFANVAEWRTYPGYSERERLAIEYAERFALAHRDIDDAFFARLRAAYSDAEILDLTVCIGAWIALGRTLHVLGIDSYCRIP